MLRRIEADPHPELHSRSTPGPARRAIRALPLVLSGVVALAVVAAIVIIAANHQPSVSSGVTSGSTQFPRNASGQTYGSAAGLLPRQQPELIAVTGQSTSGGGHVNGYVLRSQLNDDDCGQVKTPKAAVACTRLHAGTSRTIPIYAQNGTTVIGTFTIQSGSSSP